MTSRERFEAWCHESNFWGGGNHAWEIWQAAERQALERAARYFEDRTYDSDVAKAIRALNESKED